MMEPSALECGVIVTPLRKIPHPKGDILHGIKASEGPCFDGFGEAYFSTIHHNEMKGWKCHRRMTMNAIVPVGEVEFHIHSETLGMTHKIDIGPQNYNRLTIPPGLWVAFKGVSQCLNLILNIASIEHDPTEAIDQPLSRFPLGGR